MSHIGHRTACGATITTGSDFYFLNGAGAAIEGSETDHGGLILRNRFHTFVGTAERDQTARALRNAAVAGNAVALACDTDEDIPQKHERPPISPRPLPPESLVPVASDEMALAVIDPAVLPETLFRLADHAGNALCLLGNEVSAPVPGTAPWLTLFNPSDPLSDTINRYFGTNIDFVAYAEWEHGQELDGYVLCYQGAEQNASGVTIGTGNDLAAADLNNMRDFARLYAAQIPEPPGLIQKIAPYVGLRKQAACNFLSDHPLSLTIPEVEWLDAWRFNYTLNSSYLYDPPKPLPAVGYKSFAAAYDTVRLQKIQTGQISRHPPDTQSVLTPFKQLPMREQTIFFSCLSHNRGNDIGAGNLDLLVSRNWDKIWAFYADKLKGAYKRRYTQENDYFNSHPA